MSASLPPSSRSGGEPEFVSAEPEPPRPETPPGVRVELSEPLRKLLKHPALLAGGALAAGALGARALMTPGGRRVAEQLARTALKQAAPLAGTVAAESLIERGLEKIRPHAVQYLKKILAETPRKKE